MSRLPSITGADAQRAAEAASKVVLVHQRLCEFVREGHTLAAIDTHVARTLESIGAKSCFKGYRAGRLPPFPSHACLSVNECVVHGTAGYYEKPLVRGDLISIDIGVSYRGWIGDAAWTYAIGEASDEAKRLMKAGMESLRLGIEQLRPDNTYMEWARTVQGCVEGDYKLHLIRGLGGHGYGRRLHEPPFVSNTVPRFPMEWPDGTRECRPGTLVAVEPMIGLGTGDTKQAKGEWPIFTADGSLAVHYEHDVLITDDGPRVLTEGLDELPQVLG